MKTKRQMNLLMKPVKALRRLPTFILIAVATFLMLQGCTKERLEATSEKVYQQVKEVYHNTSIGDSIITPKNGEGLKIYIRGETKVNGAYRGPNYFVFIRDGSVVLQGAAGVETLLQNSCSSCFGWYLWTGTRVISFYFDDFVDLISQTKYYRLVFLDVPYAWYHEYWFEELK